jgi:hypothetical protein
MGTYLLIESRVRRRRAGILRGALISSQSSLSVSWQRPSAEERESREAKGREHYEKSHVPQRPGLLAENRC